MDMEPEEMEAEEKSSLVMAKAYQWIVSMNYLISHLILGRMARLFFTPVMLVMIVRSFRRFPTAYKSPYVDSHEEFCGNLILTSRDALFTGAFLETPSIPVGYCRILIFVFNL
jgi:hypothetical protein